MEYVYLNIFYVLNQLFIMTAPPGILRRMARTYTASSGFGTCRETAALQDTLELRARFGYATTTGFAPNRALKSPIFDIGEFRSISFESD